VANVSDVRPRVLVVEDEWMIAEDFGDILDRAGFDVVGPANTEADAQKLVSTERFSAALLDVNLGGESTFAVADELARRGIPYAYITGYNENDLPERVKSHMLLSKPVSDENLPKVVRRLIAGRA
ncbi:MAG: response regulator, partial [Henriciella sp.]|uniref:response regulator n=1 Tax=Henriciella sp. TaxID=1968823 RepID=UPI003C783FEF